MGGSVGVELPLAVKVRAVDPVGSAVCWELTEGVTEDEGVKSANVGVKETRAAWVTEGLCMEEGEGDPVRLGGGEGERGAVSVVLGEGVAVPPHPGYFPVVPEALWDCEKLAEVVPTPRKERESKMEGV